MYNSFCRLYKFLEKLKNIPPSFGINIWNRQETFFNCLSNYLKCRLSPLTSKKRFAKDYYHQYKRPKLEDYLNESEKATKQYKSFVFMIASLWEDKNCIDKTNIQRKEFIEVCKKADCNFEGGFIASQSHPQYSSFKEHILTKRYSSKAYLEKTKLSDFVFNTPAVHQCHGWKLGEYLALGKAIISTPLSNQLPKMLEHEKNVHFCKDQNKFDTAINLLLTNKKYKNTLEKGAQNYFTTYASPKAVIQSLLKET
jgi:hypothetical protein